MVSVVSSKGIALRVLTTLKHKLLALIRMVLVAHPPAKGYAKWAADERMGETENLFEVGGFKQPVIHQS